MEWEKNHHGSNCCLFFRWTRRRSNCQSGRLLRVAWRTIQTLHYSRNNWLH